MTARIINALLMVGFFLAAAATSGPVSLMLLGCTFGCISIGGLFVLGDLVEMRPDAVIVAQRAGE